MAKILIADDEEDVVEFIKVALENKGHEVKAISSGDKVFDEIAKTSYDLLILDIMMPGMDGYNVQLKMNEDEKFKHIPIIMVSALKPAKILFEKFKQVKGFLSKPFEPSELIEKVDEALR